MRTIESSTGEMASRIFLEGRRIITFPLRLKEVVAKLKLDKPVQIIESDLLSETGAYIEEWEFGYCIWVNKNHLEVQQRFSVCHEFGHLYFGHEGVSIHKINRYDPGQRIIEEEANDFAAGLLMPADQMEILAALCDKNILGLLDAVQNHFGVSMSAAAKRIIKLGLFDGAIILKDGYRTCFDYTSPSFCEVSGCTGRYSRKLISGKVLHVLIGKRYGRVG